MYAKWNIKRWETMISDELSIAMVSLLDYQSLYLTFQVLRGSNKNKRFLFKFESSKAYRNILEEYRLELWHRRSDLKIHNLGGTWIIPDSPWILELRKNEPLWDIIKPPPIHYVICTEDDVVEILTNKIPQIVELEPAAESDEIVGKSMILYSPEDRMKIEEIIKELKGFKK